jgi:hypothetical protein
VSVYGVRESVRVAALGTLLEVAGLLVVVAVGLPRLGQADLFEASHGLGGLASAAALLFFAFIGFEGEIVQLAEETRDPHRTVPRALLLSIGITEARDDRQLGRLKRRYLGVDLLICDDLGFVPFDKTGGELLFNLLADRYERRSTVITTNLAFGEWVQVFGSEKLTTALLDRLGHHATVLTTKGESYRTKKRRTTKSTTNK